MSGTNKFKGFCTELVRVCPVLPHMALGIALSWAFIAYSGTAWLSDTEVDGTNISTFFINMSIALSVVLLAASRFPARVASMLARPAFVLGGSAVASLGCFIVIIIGPYYLYPYMTETLVMVLFYFGGFLSGVGIAAVFFKCFELYGALPPRRAILYVSFAHMVVAITYFIIIGSPDWAPIEGGPSFIGIGSFVLLPLIAGALAVLQPAEHNRAWASEGPMFETIKGRGIEGAFWKLVAVVFVFAVVMTAVRAAVIETSAIADTFNSTRLIMLLRMMIATAFVCAAISVRSEFFRFGKLFSIVMVCGVAVVAVLPSVGVLHIISSQAVSVISILFDIVFWCILSFIVYQKRILATFIFGVAYGVYQLGCFVGWALGAYFLSALGGEPYGFAVYLVLVFVVLICAFVLFSEKEFSDLFKPVSDGESSLEELLAVDLVQEPVVGERIDPQERLSRVVDEIAAECGLSNREREVFQCLAAGYGSSAVSKKLQISWNTVRTHTRKVYAKLDVHSKQELIDLVEARVGGPARREQGAGAE